MASNINDIENANLLETYFNRVPNEILQAIVSNTTEAADRINLALSQRSRFLSNTFNVFVQCASTQVNLQARRSAPELNEVQVGIPLLYAAIENGFDWRVVEEIIKTYRDFYPDSINGIWGQVPKAVQTPLHCAVKAAAKTAVQTLLDNGANQQFRFSASHPILNPNSLSTCTSLGLVHQQCVDATGTPLRAEDCCNTPVGTAIDTAWYYGQFAMHRRSGGKVLEIEQCILRLLLGPNARPYPRAHKLKRAGRVGLKSVVRTVVTFIMGLDDNDQEKRDFITEAANGFMEQVMLGPEGNGDLYEWLGTIGDPNNYVFGIEPNAAMHHVVAALTTTKPRNAMGILKTYRARGLPLPPLDGLADAATDDDNLTYFTKPFYQMLSDGVFSVPGGDVPIPDIKSLLLTKAIENRSIETCRWLVTQDCPVTARHARAAKDCDEMVGDFQSYTLSGIVRMARPWFRTTFY